MIRVLVPALCAAVAVACGPPEDRPGVMAGAAVPDQAATGLRPGGPGGWPTPSDSMAGTPWTRQDWEIFRSTIRQADALGLDTLPAGEAVAATGRLLVGTPYVARTLEVPGSERLVVNLRGLDCVTFVENALALARFHRIHGSALLDDPPAARAAYEGELAALRYRSGLPRGYAGRLHYFSDWLRTHAAAGRLTLVTGELGGVPDPEPVDFMSTHPEAYDQLADPATLDAIRRVEGALADAGPRLVIPEDRIEAAAPDIRPGDVIAATSTVAGLDVAHTGLAVRVNGALHLMHAPLVGDSVTISERTLAQRILSIASQDGIMVARPDPRWLGGRRGVGPGEIR